MGSRWNGHHLIYNPDANNQFRFVTSLRRRPCPDTSNDPDAQAADIRDVERERDGLASFSWVHTFRPGLLLTVSPFYHYNRANYDGDPNDAPVSTRQHRGRNMPVSGAQIAFSAVSAKHNASVGFYGFGQHDDESVKLIANDGTGLSVTQNKITSGHLEAVFLEDQNRAFSWLRLTAGFGSLTSGGRSRIRGESAPGRGNSHSSPEWVLREVLGTTITRRRRYPRCPVRYSILPYPRGLGSSRYAVSATRNTKSD